MSDQERGFAIEDGVFAPAEVAQLATDLGDVARSRAGARHLRSHPAVAQVAQDERLLAIARRWLGPEARPYRATLFDKSPSANWLVVWHQDTALPLRHRSEVPGWGPWSVKAGVLYAHAPARALEGMVALRLHIDDSLSSNGPLRVLQGTHLRGVLSDEEIQALARSVPPLQCLVRRGGVIAMKPLLVHASSKSTSGLARRVLHIEYAASIHQEAGLELSVA